MDKPTGGKPPAGPRQSTGKPASKAYGQQRSASAGAKPYAKPYSDRREGKPGEAGARPYAKPYSDRRDGKPGEAGARPYAKPYSDRRDGKQGEAGVRPYAKPYSDRRDGKPGGRPGYQSARSDRYPGDRTPTKPNTDRRPAPKDESAVSEQTLRDLAAAITTEPVTALSSLAAHAKKLAARDLLNRIFADRAVLYTALSAPEPKARKNAARLLGALGQQSDANALIETLSREKTLFVIPSVLLALGAIAGDKAEKAISGYVVPAAADETEEKHAQEILEAHAKALASLTRNIPLPQRTRLASPHELLLVPPVGFGQILLKETTSRGFQAELQTDGVHVVTDQIKTLQEIRCAQEILLPIATNITTDAQAIAKLANETLTRPYRIELRNYNGDRAAFIRSLSLALGGDDNPSRYADELRVVCNRDHCGVFIRPRNVEDTRFAYRLRSLPASIHPVQAACLARYALSFVSAARPRTLDPFCGSGTLLFELERATATAMIGVDISERALDTARENAAAAHSAARFVHKDILKFEPRDPFDLVLSNMPFGNRVGTHSANETLYRDFVHALPKLLVSGGIAVLYTMEHKLLAACLEKEPLLTVAAELATEAGGLNPRVTVLRRK